MKITRFSLDSSIRPTSAAKLIKTIEPLAAEDLEGLLTAVLRAGEDEYGYPSVTIHVEMEEVCNVLRMCRRHVEMER